ncbi:hypothetical protein QUA71_18570 [Microcoleus sp. MON1_C5]|uniref:hypothetical protein n=1 Tax=Microcoleus sp. MON1_C5 TaxID=2818828 RepID=UPI002FD79A9C
MLKAKVLTGDRSGKATKHQIKDADRPMELQCSHLRVASIAAGVAADGRAFILGQFRGRQCS